jgi:hypothetical protein
MEKDTRATFSGAGTGGIIWGTPAQEQSKAALDRANRDRSDFTGTSEV